MLLNPFIYHAPSTAAEAAKLFNDLPDARLLAGGTIVLNHLKVLKKRGLKTPRHIISLKKVQDLQGIDHRGGDVVIKAMTTLSDIYDSSDIKNNLSVLKGACRNMATHPIRNMATVGGNLASRYTWTELGTIFVALQADLHFIGPSGQEEVVSAEHFFRAGAKTTKLLASVSVKKNDDARCVYKRVQKRSAVDIPLLAVCIKTIVKKNRFTGTVVAVNNTTAFAQRDLCLEQFLNNSQIKKTTATEALDHLDKKIYEDRGSDYKKHMFRVCIKDVIEQLAQK